MSREKAGQVVSEKKLGKQKAIDISGAAKYNETVKQKNNYCFTMMAEVRKLSETSMVNFRMDTDLKKNMERVCKDMGLSMTTAFTIFAAKVCREKRIPFEINADPFFSASNLEYLSRVTAEIDSGKSLPVEHELIEG